MFSQPIKAINIQNDAASFKLFLCNEGTSYHKDLDEFIQCSMSNTTFQYQPIYRTNITYSTI